MDKEIINIWRKEREMLQATAARRLALLKRCGKVIAVADNIEPAILIMDEKLIDDLAKELSDDT